MYLFEKTCKLIIKYPIVGLGSFSALVPVIMGIWRWQFLGKSSKRIFYFCIFYIITDIPIWITAAESIDNHFIINVRDTAISIFLGSVYYIGLRNERFKKGYLLLMILMFLVLIYQCFQPENAKEVLWIPRISLIIFTFFFFFKLLGELKIINILNFPFFWYNCGILIFSTNTIFILIFSKYTLQYNIEYEIYQSFSNFFEYINFTLFLFFSMGFLVSKKNFKNLAK